MTCLINKLSLKLIVNHYSLILIYKANYKICTLVHFYLLFLFWVASGGKLCLTLQTSSGLELLALRLLCSTEAVQHRWHLPTKPSWQRAHSTIRFFLLHVRWPSQSWYLNYWGWLVGLRSFLSHCRAAGCSSHLRYSTQQTVFLRWLPLVAWTFRCMAW